MCTRNRPQYHKIHATPVIFIRCRFSLAMCKFRNHESCRQSVDICTKSNLWVCSFQAIRRATYASNLTISVYHSNWYHISQGGMCEKQKSSPSKIRVLRVDFSSTDSLSHISFLCNWINFSIHTPYPLARQITSLVIYWPITAAVGHWESIRTSRNSNFAYGIMTSRNVFRITGPLWGESHRTKNVKFWNVEYPEHTVK